MVSRRKKKRRRSRPTQRHILPHRPTLASVPGTLEIAQPTHAGVQLIAYGGDRIEEQSDPSMEQIAARRSELPVTWVNVDGAGDPVVMDGLGKLFGLHALALEDAVNTHQRPKLEDYGDVLFLVLRMPQVVDGELELEQVSLFVGKGFVVSVQERPGDCFDPVRQRLREGRGRLRERGASYLTYAIIDAVIDNYFPLLEGYGDDLDSFEAQALDLSQAPMVRELHSLRHELGRLRRVVWPLRELLGVLLRGSVALLEDDDRVFYRDCHDHCSQLVDAVDSLRDMAAGLMELRMSSVSHRMNEVMKVLAMISTVFIPLSFIAGLYGMNFAHMPELGWRFGYPFALGVMVSAVALSLWYFRRKGWIGSRGDASN